MFGIQGMPVPGKSAGYLAILMLRSEMTRRIAANNGTVISPSHPPEKSFRPSGPPLEPECRWPASANLRRDIFRHSENLGKLTANPGGLGSGASSAAMLMQAQLPKFFGSRSNTQTGDRPSYADDVWWKFESSRDDCSRRIIDLKTTNRYQL